jgi:cytidine deaminase
MLSLPPDWQELARAAWQARSHAYAPYSHFAVGAALLTADGTIFAGTNVENLSFGLTNCAERSAVFSAVAQGHREFQRLIIVADTGEPISPCGACRQVLAEFSPELPIMALTAQGHWLQWTLTELLPRPAVGILDRGST